MSNPPQAVVIAGPNGSGKSTCAELLLPSDMTFINADMIAQEISGTRSTTADLQAGRILVERLDALTSKRKDFAVETTLATRKLEPRLQKLKELGYETHLIFLWMPSDDLAVQRVAARVRAGGHNVPEETIRRRFRRGLELFFSQYKPMVDSWKLYDNSRIADPKLIAWGRDGELIECRQESLYNDIRAIWDVR
ncbi:MAG: AAA family ATPase [Armatimonadetes bacterium]|nr:AAA family ATPase [Armatimonadota bacterium]